VKRRQQALKPACHGILAALAAALAMGEASSPAATVTYYVDQRHPQAADANAGTNEAAPLQTIQAALDKVTGGETVLVKAGTYREMVMFRSPARSEADRVTLSAYGDDKVIVDGSDIVPPGAWAPVEESAGVYVATVRPQSYPGLVHQVVPLVFWRGKRLERNWKKAPGAGWVVRVPEAGDANTWCFDRATSNLYVNLGGADPRDERTGLMEASVRPDGVSSGWQGYRTVRKITVQRCGRYSMSLAGIGTSDLVVEDCEVRDGFQGIMLGDTLRPTVRRCAVHDVSGIAIRAGGTQAARIYDNVVYAHAQNWDRNPDNFWNGAAFTLFAAEYGRFCHNVVLQPYEHMDRGYRGCGFWPDVIGPSHWYVGNAVCQSQCGFYIEASSHGNILQWNTLVKTDGGIVLSVNSLNTAAENYCSDNTLGLELRSTECTVLDMSHNLLAHNWLRFDRTGLVAGPEPSTNVQTRNYAQGNVYEVGENGSIAWWPPVRGWTNLTEFRQATGQETLGREGRINLDDLGLVWARVHGLDASHEVIPVFGNPDCARTSYFLASSPYFWTRGVESSKDTYPDGWATHDSPGDVYPGVMIGFRPWCWSSRGAVAAWLDGAAVSNTPVGGKYLAAGALPGHGFRTNGVGWWSPSLPAVGGATVDVGLWMKIEDVKPAPTNGCGAVIYVEWSDWNGQNKSRSYVLGGEPGAKPERPELTTGTRGWTEVRGSVTAPDGARRMALFLGGRGCTGKLAFDAIHTLAARPGRPIRRELAGVKPEGRPLLDPATLNFFEISVSNVVNRALWDDLVGSGKGWQDRGGPGWDLSELGTGRKEYGGVPFTILAPWSCVVLNAHYRLESGLPKSARIPVGRKADVLYFLHTGAWLTGKPGALYWAYQIHYADGTGARLDVVPGVNVREWGAAGAWKYEDSAVSAEAPTGGMRRASMPFERKGGTWVPVGGVTCVEWMNPRKDVPIKAIEISPPQQNLWVSSGSGSLPSV
jgi:parallel beta-helix repeat protein